MDFSNPLLFWTLGLVVFLSFAALSGVAIFKYFRRKADENNAAPYFNLEKRLADIENSTAALQSSYMESRKTA